MLHAREGNLVEAVAIFEGLRDDHPTMFEALNNLAVLYAKLGRLDDARKALVGALEMRPDAVIYANLGDVYMKLAERAYERAHELRIEQEVAAVEGGEAGAASQAEAAPAEPPAAEPAEEKKEVAALAAVPVEPEVAEVPVIPVEPEVVEEPVIPEEPEVVEEPEIPEEPGVVEEPERPEEPEEAVVLAARENCIQTGWFDDREVADEAAAWLREHGAEAVAVRSEEQQIIKNYQVYLPPAESREAAVATVRALRGQGVEDLLIIDRGERIYGVSLGVFPQQALHEPPGRRGGEAGLRGHDHGEHEDRHGVRRRRAGGRRARRLRRSLEVGVPGTRDSRHRLRRSDLRLHPLNCLCPRRPAERSRRAAKGVCCERPDEAARAVRWSDAVRTRGAHRRWATSPGLRCLREPSGPRARHHGRGEGGDRARIPPAQRTQSWGGHFEEALEAALAAARERASGVSPESPGEGARSVKRFLRDAAVALFVGAVLIALAMFLRPTADDHSSGTGPASTQESSTQ